MNSKTKRRMGVVTGIIIMVLIVILAVVGGASSAKTVTIDELAAGDYNGADKKIQVTGNVVADSYSTTDGVLTFSIYDPDGDESVQIEVTYEGAASSTFGNDVTAICTGKMTEDGVLVCSTLVTKCPSKYASGVDALSVDELLDYGDSMIGTMVKVTGVVVDGTLTAAGSGDRFVLADADSGTELAVLFDDALSEEVTDGSVVVLTGSLNDEGKFEATEVALEG